MCPFRISGGVGGLVPPHHTSKSLPLVVTIGEVDAVFFCASFEVTGVVPEGVLGGPLEGVLWKVSEFFEGELCVDADGARGGDGVEQGRNGGVGERIHGKSGVTESLDEPCLASQMAFLFKPEGGELEA